MDNFKDMNMDMDSPCNICVGVHVLVQADMSILAWLFQRTTIMILTIAWTWHGHGTDTDTDVDTDTDMDMNNDILNGRYIKKS